LSFLMVKNIPSYTLRKMCCWPLYQDLESRLLKDINQYEGMKTISRDHPCKINYKKYYKNASKLLLTL
jgi:hypothetical protein